MTKSLGEQLAEQVRGRFDLEPHEEVLLSQACATLDIVEGLERALERDGLLQRTPTGTRASAAVVELRQQRQLLGRLLASLRVPDTDEGRRPQRRPARGVSRLRAVRGGDPA